MQTSGPEDFNSPRRSLDIEDYIDILRRHSAWIAGPAFAGLVIAVVVAFLWPNTYVSTATIRVVPPQVPENLVPTNVNSAISERINSMYQTVSSSGNLTNIILSFNLFPRERQRKPMADVVEDMRKAIRIGNVGTIGRRDRDVPAFQLSFSYEDRLLAQKVAADLVSRFMTESTRERTQQSVITTQFLQDQVENAKKELDAVEEKLAAYRQSYQGRLPEQMGHNQMQLNMLEQRNSGIQNSLARVSQERLLLESDLRNLKAQRASLNPAPELAQQRRRNQSVEQQDRMILQFETALSNLREHYKDTYPDVQRVISQLNTARKVREALVTKEADENEAANSAPDQRYDQQYEKESRVLDSSIQRLETQLKANALQTQNYERDLSEVEKQIRAAQERITAAPASEQQYGNLLREESLANQKYQDLNKRRSQSSISEDLERRNQGETLELLEPASLPGSPTQPKRPMIIGAGIALGLMIGVVLAGAREARDGTLKNLKDVRAYTRLNVLASIPLLENDVVVRRRRRLAWLAWTTACLVGILIMTGTVFYYYSTKA
jgi:polysaccharide chain length determinant protein (PEP-CTERM system associated)